MSNTSPKVLIVGAGPSGLICALSLLRNGVPVRIIEKSVQPRPGQRGAGIMPRSLEVFDSLGIADTILELAIATPPTRKYEIPKGWKPIHEFEMAPRTAPTPLFPYLNIVLLGQNNVEGIIHTALTEYSCHVERGTELVSLEQFEHGVEVKLLKHGLGNGQTGAAETARYDWVVGADGAHSVIRKQSAFTFDGETRERERLVVGDIHIDGLSQKFWHVWGDASNIVISLRPTEVPGMFNFALGGNVDHVQLSSDENALKRFLAENVGSEEELKFNDLRWLSLFTPSVRMVEKFQHGRILLVGDAAHVHSPTGGQGMNSGVQDSFNLGWKLALVQRNLAPSSLLQSYSEERIPVIREMLDRTTKILKQTFAEKGNAQAWARPAVLLQLGINYRWSSIVLDEQKLKEEGVTAEGTEKEIVNAYGGHADGPLRAGDRAPDASEMVNLSATPQSPGRLFNSFTPSHHTVLIFTPAHDQCLALIQCLAQYPRGTIRSAIIVRPDHGVPKCQGASIILEDGKGQAHTGYGIENNWGVVVVRPDGVVGAIVSGLEGLQKYFEGIFGLRS